MKDAKNSFIWDPRKETINIDKHGVDFTTAAKAFRDIKRKIFTDSQHSKSEARYFCIGKVNNKILTVRFLHRKNKIRIIGAGYWRKVRKYYEKD
ncbi:MAG: BrnT family toxin [Candidatus Omnitrophota bacterium]